jgi:hypothetical protein
MINLTVNHLNIVHELTIILFGSDLEKAIKNISDFI